MTLDEVKQQRRWALHLNKRPMQPNGLSARTNDPSTWSTWVELQPFVAQYSGVGVMLGGGDTHIVHVHMTNHVNTIDGDGMQRTLEKHADVVEQHVGNALRKRAM